MDFKTDLTFVHKTNSAHCSMHLCPTPPSPTPATFLYDPAGNIASKQVETSGTGATMTTYSHNSLNHNKVTTTK